MTESPTDKYGEIGNLRRVVAEHRPVARENIDLVALYCAISSGRSVTGHVGDIDAGQPVTAYDE